MTTSRNNIKPVLDKVQKYRDLNNMQNELKWSKVSNQKKAEYEVLIDYGFQLIEANQARFDMICYDTRMANHKKFNAGDRDVGLSKLYYQILLHRPILKYGRQGDLHIRLDKRASTTSTDQLKDMLNNSARNNGVDGDPVKILEAESSKACDLLQLTDVLLGAFSAAKNERTGGRLAKKELAEYVMDRSGLETLDSDSERTRNLTYWNFKPKRR